MSTVRRYVLAALALATAVAIWFAGRAAWPAALLLAAVAVWPKRREPDRQDLLAAAAHYPHQLANDLQQASGWLQLGHGDRALQSLQAAQKQLLLEAALGRSVPMEHVQRILPLLVQGSARGLVRRLHGEAIESPNLPLETVLLVEEMVKNEAAIALTLRDGTWRLETAVEPTALQEVAAAGETN